MVTPTVTIEPNSVGFAGLNLDYLPVCTILEDKTLNVRVRLKLNIAGGRAKFMINVAYYKDGFLMAEGQWFTFDPGTFYLTFAMIFEHYTAGSYTNLAASINQVSPG